MSTFDMLQQVKSGNILVSELKEMALDRYQVSLFIASELLVLKGLAESLPDENAAEELGRISSMLVERAKEES